MSAVSKCNHVIDPFATQALGNSELIVPQLGFGGGTLGDPNQVTSEEQAQATLATAYDLGIRYFDTAPWYGLTKSERRMGKFFQQHPRDTFTVNTKVGRIFSATDNLDPLLSQRWQGGLPYALRFDYTREGFQRSYADSLQRLCLDKVDVLTVHDLDYKFHLTDEGVDARLDELDQGGGFAWLQQLKASGEIKAIGAGVNQAPMIPKLVSRFQGWDYFLVAMPYTLLDQPVLDGLFDLCDAQNISIIIGAVFASGILATGVQENAIYAYKPADRRVVEKVQAIESVCQRYGIPLGAAALQFPLGHPIVAAVIPGANSPEIVKANLAWLQVAIPEDFWQELKALKLLRSDAPVPEAGKQNEN